ncbi:esterase FE4-like isoform X2 [Sitophilus oryzae]|uniref:Carboxylic ester hydrolase n=1 Tax=Sitophilus oryzae TaxID=7048 RepID=A0A6J2Y1T7_SITOR|nr:esterase FE4-like isoform X2 [Sitophilus oryzae]
MLLKIVALAVVFLNGHICQQVNTPDGPILGTTEYSIAGTPYSSFYSIPYAKPPVGTLRFQAPQAVEPWTEVYNATTEQKRVCYQLYQDLPEETEDCLLLNVYVPQSNATDLPVMLFIHGGGFISGSGLNGGPQGFYRPNFWMDNNVILISINYRLGVFDEIIPGNNGLKDQVQAMKWVQRNIASFGGDPKKVLIFGQSAGSASVGWHLLSSSSTGLFRAAILQSGTPLCPWAYQRNQTTISYKTASLIDSQFNTSRDSNKLLEVLQSVDAKAIDDAALTFANWDSSQPSWAERKQLEQGFYFAPVVEVENNDSFVTGYPYVILENGNFNKIPIMIGTDADEGLMNLSEYLDSQLAAYDEAYSRMNPGNLHLVDAQDISEVGNAIKEEYSPNDTFLNNKLGAFEYFTEQDFTKSIVKHAELHSAEASTYFYEFSYSGEMGFNTYYRYPGSTNITHGEEMGYIFSTADPNNFSVADQLVHKRLLRLWINFATYLNPTPEVDELLQNITWPELKPGAFKFVNILSDLVVTAGTPKAKRIAFWDSLYEKYGIKPFDTY